MQLATTAPSTLASTPAPAPAPLPTPAPAQLAAFDLVLRHHTELDALVLDETAQPWVLQRLLGLSLIGLAVHGLLLGSAYPLLGVSTALGGGSGGAPLAVSLAMVLSFLGTTCLCLPSFWFYTQLAGLDGTLRLVVCQALRAQAATSTLLLGLAPFYAALLLSSLHGTLPPGTALALGWALPFLCGLGGVRALLRAFAGVLDKLPITLTRRGPFLLKLVLAWAAVFTVVCAALLWVLAGAMPAALGVH